VKSRRVPWAAGFSLLETVCVLFILSLCAAVVVPAVVTTRSAVDTEADAIRAILAGAGRDAATLRVHLFAVIDMDSGLVTSWAVRPEMPAPEVRRRYTIHFQVGRGRHAFWFAPDGRSGGGPVVIRDLSQTAVVRIDRWTGRVNVER
jgi:prepilin-type N-terminal cleavage/methylation domain-containing protein